jgi:hypothetical protein
MAADQGIISPYSLDEISAMLRQKRASGQVVSDNDIRMAYEGALRANAQTALQQRAQRIQQSEFNQRMQLEQKQYADERHAAETAALFGMGNFGIQGIGGAAKAYDWLTQPTANPLRPGPSHWQKWFGSDTANTATTPADMSSSFGIGEAVPSAVSGKGIGAGLPSVPAVPFLPSQPAVSSNVAQMTPMDFGSYFNPIGTTAGAAADTAAQAAAQPANYDWMNSLLGWS